ncbi:MAG TPA: c-type cytochrome [Candidatus Krumholzibacteria bacterium]|nr:c-type cytochrome [Candidatus Krumholzibacteria bacterium]
MIIARRFAIACLLVSLTATSAVAQIPDKFTNLKVLPKDITKPDLIKIMRGYAGDLGVRCAHCHYAKNPEDFSSIDFASDQKPEKDVARNMMRMAQSINATLDKDFKDSDPNHLTVTCFTCHHGNDKPETIADAILPVLKKDGPEAAAAHYKDLRKEYYGSATYDFSEWALVDIAEELSRDPSQVDNARALLNLNLEFYPESAATYARMGETYVAAGDTATAMTNFDKAIQLAPEDQWVKRRVAAIKAGGAKPKQ